MSLSNNVKRGHNGSKNLSAAIDEAATLDDFDVAGLPDAAAYKGKLISVSNGAAGSACLAFSDGTHWLRVLLGAAVSAT